MCGAATASPHLGCGFQTQEGGFQPHKDVAIKIPDASCQAMLDTLIQSLGIFDFSGDANYCLYTNNYTPAAGDTASNYTEATYNGYVRQTVGPGELCTWNSSVHNATTGHADAIGSTTLTFAPTSTGSSNVIHGYFVLDDSGNLMWAERFSSSVTLSALTDSIVLTPIFSFYSQS